MMPLFRSQKVYLAGPITGLSYEAARLGWRAAFGEMLLSHIHTFSPMRGKDHLQGVARFEGADVYSDNALSTGKGITARDRNDVRTSDAVVFNLLGAAKASVGSCIEYGWADAFRVPIVTVIEPNARELMNPHAHAMIEDVSGYLVPTVEDAARIVNHLLSPGT